MNENHEHPSLIDSLRFRALAETCAIGIWQLNPQGYTDFINEYLCQLLGYEGPSDFKERHVSQFYPPDVYRTVLEPELAKRQKGLSSQYSTDLLRKDGTLCHVLITGAPLKNDAGEIIGFLGLFTDLTERRHAEKALAKSEKRYRMLLDAMHEGVWTLDADDRLTYGNRSLARMLGFEPEELIGKSVFEFLPQHQIDETRERLERRHKGIPEQYVFTFHSADGRDVTALVNSVPYLDDAGNYTGLLAVAVDITDRKRLEQEKEKLQLQFMQSQKLEALGSLAAGIAHDFNNLIMAINGYAELLKLRLGESDANYADVNEIHKAGERAAGLTRQLLVFSRQQQLEASLIKINDVIGEMSNLLKRLIGEHIKFTVSLDPGAGCIHADQTQLEQMIVNLAVNARDAMPGGGALHIETARIELDQLFLDRYPNLKPGEYVRLTVHDTGMGMDESVIEHIFEPFFTTKSTGMGTGLGLSMVYGFVKQCEGEIDVISVKGEGTKFLVYLPAEIETIGSDQTDQPISSIRGHETILLVEDEILVRNLIARLLQKWGFTVLTASDGMEGARFCKEYQSGIDLMITDMVMPRMSGVELAQRALALRPDMRLIFMTGYTDSDVLEDDRRRYANLWLQKPFSTEALAQKIKWALSNDDAKIANIL
ncbi:MAG: PAS domain S-box protein [bacterium]|nr:PAS domain S-box protein [bacterium]